MAALAVVPTTHEETALAVFSIRVRAYVRQSRSENTLRGYRSDWADFLAWCESQGFRAMPASVAAVCGYLAALADSGLKAGSIQRRVSAIAAAHTTAGHLSPTAEAGVKLCLAGIRRALGTRQEGKAPVLTVDVGRMVAETPNNLLGARDRALLLMGFAGAFRRSELVGLDVRDLQFTEDGVKVTIQRSKTDQEGAGQNIGIARGSNSGTCPVRALRAWIETAGIEEGPVFRAVNRHGRPQPGRLTAQVVALVVKRYAEAAGLDRTHYAGHSLRAGLVTQAAINGCPEHLIQRQSRHRSADMLRRYIRDANLFRDNVSARVGL